MLIGGWGLRLGAKAASAALSRFPVGESGSTKKDKGARAGHHAEERTGRRGSPGCQGKTLILEEESFLLGMFFKVSF